MGDENINGYDVHYFILVSILSPPKFRDCFDVVSLRQLSTVALA